MTSVRTCPDGLRCENGSTCTMDPNNEGAYYCDCTTAVGDYAGLFCEFKADAYCTFPQEATSTWFCTNRGTCVVKVNSQQSQFACDCPDQYEGPVGNNLDFLYHANGCTMWKMLQLRPVSLSSHYNDDCALAGSPYYSI